jgi:hypothetical protein
LEQCSVEEEHNLKFPKQVSLTKAVAASVVAILLISGVISVFGGG